jgi:hypothetical protein
MQMGHRDPMAGAAGGHATFPGTWIAGTVSIEEATSLEQQQQPKQQ